MSWTDDRLDDLSRHMDEQFKQVDHRFAQVDKRFDKVESEIGALRTELNLRFDSLQRTLLLGMCGLVGTALAALVSVLAA